MMHLLKGIAEYACACLHGANSASDRCFRGCKVVQQIIKPYIARMQYFKKMLVPVTATDSPLV